MRENPVVSLVIPFHNEGSAVDELFPAIDAALAPIGHVAFEIICIDDGSTDDTSATTLIAGFCAPPCLGNAVAFLVATTVSYLINTQWSFASRLSRRTLRRYIVVAAIGCLLTVVVSGAAQLAELDYRLDYRLGILLVTPITFLLHNRWTYH